MTTPTPDEMIDITKIPQEPELVEYDRTPAPAAPIPGIDAPDISERNIRQGWRDKHPSRRPARKGDDTAIPIKPYRGVRFEAEMGVEGADNGWPSHDGWAR